jgi:prepilin-type N-terminal cleavage/methylation domain-containing protein
MKRSAALNTRGFTIIELMTTLALLSWLMLTVFGFMIQIDNTLDKTERRLVATTTMYEKYQEYETKTFANLTQGTAASSYQVEDFTSTLPASIRSPRSGKVYIRDITPTLKKVDVRLTYTESPGKSRTLNISTGIQESGVGR